MGQGRANKVADTGDERGERETEEVTEGPGEDLEGFRRWLLKNATRCHGGRAGSLYSNLLLSISVAQRSV